MATDPYPDLYFTRQQLVLTAAETVLLAKDIFKRSPAEAEITDIDRAFMQRVLLIAVDTSEKAGLLFDLYGAAIAGVTKQSIQAIVKGFAKKVAMRWFRKYIDDTPKYSAAGRAALQYSQYATDWRSRVALEDTSFLGSYLVD